MKIALKIALLSSPTKDRPIAALALLLIGVFTLALQDSLVKLMSDQTSFWQFQTLRALGNMVFAIILASCAGSMTLLMPKNWKIVYFRAVILVCCMFCFFAASPFLSVAQMGAGLYTYPLFISIFAGTVLGEKVGVWRISALIIGCGGAMLLLNPWAEDFSTLQILPIMAGFFYAINVFTTRKGCRQESPLALAGAVAVVFLFSGISGILLLHLFPLTLEIQQTYFFVAVGWPALTVIVVAFILLASLLNLLGNLCLSRAYQTADSSWLAPLDFSYLLFAALWGKVLFDTLPSAQAVLGMILIAVAGIVTVWRESRSTR